MKQISDFIQIALTLPWPLALLVCVALVLFVLQVGKSFGELLHFAGAAYRWTVARLFIPTRWQWIGVFIFSLPVFWMRDGVSDWLQVLEQQLNPAYVTADTSNHALAIYEAELSKHCDAYEGEVVKRRTRETAQKIGCSPLAIYEVAYSECGLNPFRVRDDGVAAGWIQFTRVGATGITTLQAVKDACKRRDIEKIMDWSEAYLLDRAKGVKLPDATAVYVCVFAPGFVGAGDAQALYQGWSNPAYTLNSIFDGYYLDEAGRIIRSRAAQDGRITIGELRLHLEAKKARLLQKRFQ